MTFLAYDKVTINSTVINETNFKVNKILEGCKSIYIAIKFLYFLKILNVNLLNGYVKTD